MASGWLIAWSSAAITVAALPPVLMSLGTHSIMALISNLTGRTVNASIWDKTCETTISSKNTDAFTEVNYHHKLELTYEVCDPIDNVVHTYCTNLDVEAEQFEKCVEGETVAYGHVYSRLFHVSRVVPPMTTKLAIIALLCLLAPIAWFVMMEAVTSSFVAGAATPEALLLFELIPVGALVLGYLIYFICFAVNAFGLRKDQITSSTPAAVPALSSDVFDGSVRPSLPIGPDSSSVYESSNVTVKLDDDRDADGGENGPLVRLAPESHSLGFKKATYRARSIPRMEPISSKPGESQ